MLVIKKDGEIITGDTYACGQSKTYSVKLLQTAVSEDVALDEIISIEATPSGIYPVLVHVSGMTFTVEARTVGYVSINVVAKTKFGETYNASLSVNVQSLVTGIEILKNENRLTSDTVYIGENTAYTIGLKQNTPPSGASLSQISQISVISKDESIAEVAYDSKSTAFSVKAKKAGTVNIFIVADCSDGSKQSLNFSITVPSNAESIQKATEIMQTLVTLQNDFEVLQKAESVDLFRRLNSTGITVTVSPYVIKGTFADKSRPSSKYTETEAATAIIEQLDSNLGSKLDIYTILEEYNSAASKADYIAANSYRINREASDICNYIHSLSTGIEAHKLLSYSFDYVYRAFLGRDLDLLSTIECLRWAANLENAVAEKDESIALYDALLNIYKAFNPITELKIFEGQTELKFDVLEIGKNSVYTVEVLNEKSSSSGLSEKLGALNVFSSDESIAKVTVNGSNFTIQPLKSGTVSIAVSAEGYYLGESTDVVYLDITVYTEAELLNKANEIKQTLVSLENDFSVLQSDNTVSLLKQLNSSTGFVVSGYNISVKFKDTVIGSDSKYTEQVAATALIAQMDANSGNRLNISVIADEFDSEYIAANLRDIKEEIILAYDYIFAITRGQEDSNSGTLKNSVKYSSFIEQEVAQTLNNLIASLDNILLVLGNEI